MYHPSDPKLGEVCVLQGYEKADGSLLKMLYLATMDITKNEQGTGKTGGRFTPQLEVYFEERLSGRDL